MYTKRNPETIELYMTQSIINYGKTCVIASRKGIRCPAFTPELSDCLQELKRRILQKGTLELDSSYHALINEIVLFAKICYKRGSRVLFHDPKEELKNMLAETEYYDIMSYVESVLNAWTDVQCAFWDEDERRDSEREYILYISQRIMRSGAIHC